MTAKPRTDVPDDIAAQVLFKHDHACCACNMRGLGVQIHHIDGNPTNHNPDNLAVLCFEDHNRTLLKGGFGRQLSVKEVILYRNDWIRRVEERRKAAAEVAHLADDKIQTVDDSLAGWRKKTDAEMFGYIQALPLVRRAAYTAARPRWDSGVGAEMRDATYEVIDVLERLLRRLGSFYPPNQFRVLTDDFIARYIEERFQLYHSIYEPEGPGTGGTMVIEIAAGSVMSDIGTLIEEVVVGLCFGFGLFDLDLNKWREDWTNAAESVG